MSMRQMVSRLTSYCVFFLLVIASPAAWARSVEHGSAGNCVDLSAGKDVTGLSDAVADFSRYRTSLLDRLQSTGIPGFAGLSLAQAQSELTSVHFSAAPWVAVQKDVDGMSTVRNSAQWWRTSTSCFGIRLNMSLWPAELPEVKPALALHESLGAIGIDDQDYQCSVSLWLLSYRDVVAQVFLPEDLDTLQSFALGLCRRLESTTSLKRPVKNFAMNPPARHIAGGTSTGVGGGGDGRGIELKLNQLVKLLDELKKAAPIRPVSDRAAALEAVARSLNSQVNFGDSNGIQESPAPYSSPLCLYFNGAFCPKPTAVDSMRKRSSGTGAAKSHAPCNQISEAMCKGEVANLYQCMAPSPPPHCQEKMLAAQKSCECPALPEVVAHFPQGSDGDSPYQILMNAFHAAPTASLSDIPPAGSRVPMRISSIVRPATNMKEIFLQFIFDVPNLKISTATVSKTFPHYIVTGDSWPENLNRIRSELAKHVMDDEKTNPGDYAEEINTIVRESPFIMIQDSANCWDKQDFRKVKDLILVEYARYCSSPSSGSIGYAFAWTTSQ